MEQMGCAVRDKNVFTCFLNSPVLRVDLTSTIPSLRCSPRGHKSCSQSVEFLPAKRSEARPEILAAGVTSSEMEGGNRMMDDEAEFERDPRLDQQPVKWRPAWYQADCCFSKFDHISAYMSGTTLVQWHVFNAFKMSVYLSVCPFVRPNRVSTSVWRGVTGNPTCMYLSELFVLTSSCLGRKWLRSASRVEWYHALAQPLNSTVPSRRLVSLSGTTSLLICALSHVICLAPSMAF